MDSEINDKAGKKFWDSVWNETELLEVADPHLSDWESVTTRQMDCLYRSIFKNKETKGKSFLELGCGASIWLPYFAKEFGFKVSGVDYSEIGCEQERQLLERSGVSGSIYCEDFFKPRQELHNKFDFVYSSGVAEHFTPTSECISAFEKYLKPGGVMITLIPNLTGLLGTIQKNVDKEIYDIHVLLTSEDLKKAHIDAGMEVEACKYILSTGFGMLDTSSLNSSLRSTQIKRFLLKNLSRTSLVISAFENKTFNLPATKTFSPFIACVARKPLS